MGSGQALQEASSAMLNETNDPLADSVVPEASVINK
jgi:hypothetical protein